MVLYTTSMLKEINFVTTECHHLTTDLWTLVTENEQNKMSSLRLLSIQIKVNVYCLLAFLVKKNPSINPSIHPSIRIWMTAVVCLFCMTTMRRQDSYNRQLLLLLLLLCWAAVVVAAATQRRIAPLLDDMNMNNRQSVHGSGQEGGYGFGNGNQNNPKILI
jgi:hypothetical protein